MLNVRINHAGAMCAMYNVSLQCNAHVGLLRHRKDSMLDKCSGSEQVHSGQYMDTACTCAKTIVASQVMSRRNDA